MIDLLDICYPDFFQGDRREVVAVPIEPLWEDEKQVLESIKDSIQVSPRDDERWYNLPQDDLATLANELLSEAKKQRVHYDKDGFDEDGYQCESYAYVALTPID